MQGDSIKTGESPETKLFVDDRSFFTVQTLYSLTISKYIRLGIIGSGRKERREGKKGGDGG